jgi:hypothetical protein
MKIDISKAFDTLSWEFLLEIQRRRDLGGLFCVWLRGILQTSYVSTRKLQRQPELGCSFYRIYIKPSVSLAYVITWCVYFCVNGLMNTERGHPQPPHMHAS